MKYCLEYSMTTGDIYQGDPIDGIDDALKTLENTSRLIHNNFNIAVDNDKTIMLVNRHIAVVKIVDYRGKA